MITDVKAKIHSLIAKYEANKKFYRTSNFNETQVRNEFLDPLFEILGWDIRNTAGKNTNEREVLLEEPLRKQMRLLTPRSLTILSVFLANVSSSLKRRSLVFALSVRLVLPSRFVAMALRQA